jgi:hypothetical protein
MKIGNGILRAALCAAFVFAGLTAAAFPAFAATSSLNVPAGAKEFTVDIRMNESKAFASADFGLEISGGDGVTLIKYEKSAELGASANYIPDEGGIRCTDGRYLFGFVSVSNNYSGNVNVGTLTFGYEGDAPHVLTLSRIKVAYLADDGKTAEGDLREREHFVINVSRAGEDGGAASGGGAATGGGGPASTTITADIDEDATPLATGDEHRSKYFDDVAEGYSWAYREIDALYERGVAEGIGARLFDPASNVTRGDFVLMFVRAFELKADFSDNFPDVPPEKYYYEAIGVAKALGVAKGYSADEFRPDANISRQEMITLVYRAAAAVGRPFEEGSESDTAAFADRDDVAGYAEDAVRALVKAGVIQGSNGNINPLGFATRAETAVIVYRLIAE